MLLAPAVLVIVEDARDLRLWAAALIGWSCVATAVGVLQFVGAVGNLDHTPAGSRKPSLLGDHDFAALSASALALALFVLARGARTSRERQWAWAAGIAGGVGMIVAGAFDAFVGELLAAGVDRRAAAPRRCGASRSSAWWCSRSRSGSSRSAARRSPTASSSSGPASTTRTPVSTSRAIASERCSPTSAAGSSSTTRCSASAGRAPRDEYAYSPVRRGREAPVRAAGTRVSLARASVGRAERVRPEPGRSRCRRPRCLARGVGRADRVRGAARHRRRARRAPALILVAFGAWNGYGLTAGVPLDALTWLAVGAAALAGSLHEPLTDAV